MKNNFKKIMSLLLTVVMLLGTVSAVIPFSASAESVTNQNVTVNQDGTVTITPNTDAVYNGVKYRFDAQEKNTESYAKILTDGSVEFKLADGDVMWFPGVEATDASTIHARVTAVDRATKDTAEGGMANLFAGLVYGYNGTTETGVGAIIKTNKNYRVANITRSNLVGWNGKADFSTGDGYGNGGDYYPDNKRIKDGTASHAAGVFESKGSCWKFGTTIIFDISRTVVDDIDHVSVVLTSEETGQQFASTTYEASKGYSYQGAVGFAPVWSGKNETQYSTFRFDEVTVTNCKVNGAEDTTESYSIMNTALHRTVLPGNTDYIVNGIKLRMDYVTPAHIYASLVINEDGTVTIRGNRGDLFWLPNVEIDSTSIISTSVTMDYAPEHKKASAGTVFNVQAKGAWDAVSDTAMIAALRPIDGTGSRRTLGAIDYTSATNSGGYISGGELSEKYYTPTNTTFGDTWAVGAMVKTTISQNAETGEVTAVFNDSNDQLIIDAKYTNAEYPFEGPVGYMTHWSSSSDYYSYTIHEYKITNAIVNGVKVAEFDLIAELAAYMSEEDTYTMHSNLSLNGTIGLNLRVDANYFIKGTETLVVTDKASKTVVETTLADIWNTDGGYYACTIPVNAKEMTDTFTVTLKDGEAVIATYSNLSVKSYADQLMANDAYNDWDALVTAMLNYGAAAQNLFDYNTENPAADLTNFNFDMKDVEGNDIGLPTITGTDTTIISDLSASLVLESDTALKLYFKNATDADLTVTVNGEAAELTKANDGLLCLTISDIEADQLADEFVVSINGGAFVIRISACEWAKTVVNNQTSSEDMITLAKAVAAYSAAADAKKK